MFIKGKLEKNLKCVLHYILHILYIFPIDNDI